MFLTIANTNYSGSPLFGHALITKVGQTEIDFSVWILWCTKEARGHRGEIISFLNRVFNRSSFFKMFLTIANTNDSGSPTFGHALITQVGQTEIDFCVWIFWCTKEARGH